MEITDNRMAVIFLCKGIISFRISLYSVIGES